VFRPFQSLFLRGAAFTAVGVFLYDAARSDIRVALRETPNLHREFSLKPN